jgi:hypothetical protein
VYIIAHFSSLNTTTLSLLFSVQHICTSARKALAVAASQATDEYPFESQLRDLVPEISIVPPTESSRAATEAEIDAVETDNDGGTGAEMDRHIADNFSGIDWQRLPQYCKLLRTQKHMQSWVYNYGYPVALRTNMNRIFWICQVCHQNKWIGDKSIHKMTASTSGAIKHMGIKKALHNRDNKGNIVTEAKPADGQTTLDFLGRACVKVTQDVANAIGNFDVQYNALRKTRLTFSRGDWDPRNTPRHPTLLV